MKRGWMLMMALGLWGCTPNDPDPEADAGEAPDAGSAAPYSFTLSGTCRTNANDLVGTQVTLNDSTGMTVKNVPDGGDPGCSQAGAVTFDATDARSGATGTAHFGFEVAGNKVTVSGTAQASGGTTGMATAESGLHSFNVRAGGGGVSKVRVSVQCSGAVTASRSARAVVKVEQCNGTLLCMTSEGGLPTPWTPAASGIIEETTGAPNSVVACLRIGFTAQAGGLSPTAAGTASTSGSAVITIEPL